MTMGELIIVQVLLLFLLWTCFYMTRYHIHVQAKVGTFVSMIVGANVGFLVGMGSYFFFAQPPFMATLFGSFIGLGVGWFVAIPVSTFAIVVGSFSGMISGIIGVWVIQVVSIEQAHSVWLFFSLLALFWSMFILFIILKRIPANEDVFVKKFIQHPLILGLTLIVIFYIYGKIERFFPQAEDTTTPAPPKTE
ncbi:hypothetical protein [Metabacillus iocasae]|uniref:Phosphate/sulfate permease n=1 Tax=Priestia iocasae TaxID=2291674 RepID=A0ABS2QW31_9BACI|nr:hypothetical protein [Metabacillus iocasae]MBM7703152.1 phosphate/sulfate permease [Metabacillus iocasae]